jgi:hypothetical protein
MCIVVIIFTYFCWGWLRHNCGRQRSALISEEQRVFARKRGSAVLPYTGTVLGGGTIVHCSLLCWWLCCSQCCNTCEVLRTMYELKSWSVAGLGNTIQCQDSAFGVEGEGCNIAGHMQVNKVFNQLPGCPVACIYRICLHGGREGGGGISSSSYPP